MPTYVYFLIAATPFALLLIFAILLKLGKGVMERSPAEVAEFLRSCAQGRTHPFDVDDFEHIPIKDPRLDEIRERFVQLGKKIPYWNGEGPFPSEGAAELQALIEQAESLRR